MNKMLALTVVNCNPGLLTREIAARLRLSDATVRKHLWRLVKEGEIAWPTYDLPVQGWPARWYPVER